MKTPEQQSILAAELLGWKFEDEMWWSPEKDYPRLVEQLPSFNYDANASLLLVEWMKEKHVIRMATIGGRWHVQIGSFTFSSDTLPLAILGAFLKANGKDIE